MNEHQQIARSLRQLAELGEPAVLATVVRVEGSAYRRPGARMLVTPTGTRVGCVSGGCLERDVRRRGANLDVGQTTIVTYDSTADEETRWTLALGCNGRVDILIERLDPAAALRLAIFFEAGIQDDRPMRSATVIRSPSGAPPLGTRYFAGETLPPWAGPVLLHELAGLRYTRTTQFMTPVGPIDLLLERIDPPQRLIIFGAGWDAKPVLDSAKQLGWHVTIVDPRHQAITNPQFDSADRRVPNIGENCLTRRTAAIVMHHDYDADMMAVETLMSSDAGYVGVLGPRARTDRILADARIAATRSLHAPVGLDIGAETPQEIALAVIAEIVAWRSGHDGGRLKDRDGSIHAARHEQDIDRPPRSRPIDVAVAERVA